ncbi:MAG: GNAT family N-acetyltransferase [Clostridiales Family XIII bacterium]|jgi:RimJ/RimL family protein N-acetyltransferase|nr:GNAT family N-acetyltransferase [Clostridiales Family XIII bacterium]
MAGQAIKYYPKLKGERVCLSPVSRDDAPVYARWMNDRGVTDFLGNTWMLLDVEKEKEILEGFLKDQYVFAIVKREGEELLGNINFFALNHVHRSAHCGLFIGEPERRGLGYGREALELLLGFGFGALNLNNVMLEVFSFNKAAIACYEAVGFKRIGARRQAYFLDGVYHDEIYMDILADEFRQSRGFDGAR